MNFEAELKILEANTTFEIDVQVEPEYTQVAVWLKSFGQDWSICYQNGDMNGDKKGQAIFDNEGANCGLRECRDILKDKPEFAALVDLDTYWSYEDLDELINEFCRKFAVEHEISQNFETDDDGE